MDNFQVEIPEVYQIEATNNCNLKCTMCIRKDERVSRPIGYLDPKLVRTMADRGDFSGSYFVELQMMGEPFLNPYLPEIIEPLHEVGVKVGMSTNGLLIKGNMYSIAYLDYLTISIDSADRLKYEEKRQGTSYISVVENINLLIKTKRAQGLKLPKIDLQVINMPGEDNLPGLNELVRKMGWEGKVVTRSVPDCFGAYQGRKYPKKQLKELCLNPWMSVSVHWNGDVVSCCFAAGDHNIYGNLYERDLKTIWKTSKVRKELQENMLKNYNVNNMPCQLCYMRSPVLLHQKMLANWIKE